ncbi:MAG: type II secretion system protein, partial [Patescibacteria group bacterium]
MTTQNAKSEALRKLQKALRNSGFTLAELIVVVTILAILAAIGFIALSGYSQDAKDSAVKANVRSVYSAITAESALSGNSPRYYIVHDYTATGAALSGAIVYFDGNTPTTLTGGDWNVAGTNYSAGNPDYAKLKLNQEKFRVSELSVPYWTSALAATNTGATNASY